MENSIYFNRSNCHSFVFQCSAKPKELPSSCLLMKTNHMAIFPSSNFLLAFKQGLYCDIRQLVQFIKEAHGNVFRRVALSALLDSAEKLAPGKKVEESEQESKPAGGKRLEA
jgi:hypothetical protein